ncbi:hypothetical protein AeNC1_018813, partial [Aphanomyces euteiches]
MFGSQSLVEATTSDFAVRQCRRNVRIASTDNFIIDFAASRTLLVVMKFAIPFVVMASLTLAQDFSQDTTVARGLSESATAEWNDVKNVRALLYAAKPAPAKDAAKPAAKPVAKPAAKPVAKPAAKPVAKPA